MISPDTPGEIFTAVLTFIVAIGILVAVHEFGHFWVARRLGIRVLRFSIGFGKPLWKRTAGKDPVEYVIAAIPLGGYVKLLDEREGNVPPSEAHRAFNRQPVWKRIAVLLAGPACNLIFAVAVYWVLFVAGIPSLKPIVGTVAEDSIAARAGLEYEDLIVAVDGKRVGTIEAATLAIIDDLIDDGIINLRVQSVDGAEREIALDTGEQRRALTDAEKLLPGLGFDYWRPRLPAIIEAVLPDSAAEKAGLKSGDEILKFDGQPVSDFGELVKLVEPSAHKDVTLEVKRGEEILQVHLTVGEQTVGDRKIGLIGIQPVNRPLESGRSVEEMLGLEKYGALAAVSHAAVKTWDTSIFTLRIVGRIITGDVSLKNISGPVRIAETTGFAARQGWRVFLSTLALISISLGVLNLLPIPILDGGQVVYQLAELVKGGPVSERAQTLGYQIGIAMLLLMMSLAFYNDIARHLN
ncbi:MAG TPA: RIP metalloprotease RseP [Steroidobacteraceae bacterium]